MDIATPLQFERIERRFQGLMRLSGTQQEIQGELRQL